MAVTCSKFYASVCLNVVLVGLVVVLSIALLSKENTTENNASATEHRGLRLVSRSMIGIGKAWNTRLIPSLDDIAAMTTGNQIPGSTTSKVPKLFQDLLRSQAPINENTSDQYQCIRSKSRLGCC